MPDPTKEEFNFDDIVGKNESTNEFDFSDIVEDPLKKKESTSESKTSSEEYTPLIFPKKEEKPSVGYAPPNLESKSDSSTLESTPSTSDLPKTSSYSVTPSDIKSDVVRPATTEEKDVFKIEDKKRDVESKIESTTKEFDAMNSSYEINQKNYEDIKRRIDDPNTPEDQKAILIEQGNEAAYLANRDAEFLNRKQESFIKLQEARTSLLQAEDISKNIKKKSELTSAAKAIRPLQTFTYEAYNTFAPRVISGVGDFIEGVGRINSKLNPLNTTLSDGFDKAIELADTDELKAELAEGKKEIEGRMNVITDATGEFLRDVGKGLEVELDKEQLEEDNVAAFLGQLTGNIASFIVPGKALGVAGKGMKGLAFGTETAATANGVYDAGVAAGITDKNDLAYLTIGISIPSGIFGQLGMSNVIDKAVTKKILKDTFNESLKKISTKGLTGKAIYKATEETFKEVATRITTKSIKSGVRSALEEGVTGAGQAVVEVGGKQLYDINKGEKVFDEDLFSKEGLSQVWEGAYMEALGGSIAGTVFGLVNEVGGKSAMYSKAMELKADPKKLAEFKVLLDANLESGDVSLEQYKNIKNNLNALIDLDEKIPPSIKKPERRAAAVNLLSEKARLEQETEGVDKALSVKQRERIAEIDSELENIARGRKLTEIPRREFGAKKEEAATEEKPITKEEPTTESAELTKEEIEEFEDLKDTNDIIPLEGDELKRYEQLKAKQDALSVKKTDEVDVRQQTKEEIEAKRKDELEDNKAYLDDAYAIGSEETVREHINAKYDAKLSDLEAKETTNRDKDWDNKTKEELPKSEFKTEEEFEEAIKSGTWGMLTAENPDAKQVPDAENKVRNQKAKKWLEDRGYKPQQIFGKYGNSENSFYVGNLSKEDAIEFAKEFNQESVATNEGLVYQDGTMNPRIKGKESFKPGDDFYSTIKIGGKNKSFSVEYDFDTKESATEGAQVFPKREQAKEEPKTYSEEKEAYIENRVNELKQAVEDEQGEYSESLDKTYRDFFAKEYDKAQKVNIKEQAEKVVSALSEVSPDTKVILHETKDDFRKAMKDAGASDESVQGSVLGGGFYVSDTGDIHLNLEEIKSNTLFHEGVHPILNAIAAVNPKAIDSLFEQVKEAERKLGLKNEDGEYTYSENFAKRYAEKGQPEGVLTPNQKMEAITEFIADVADGTVEITASNFDKIKQFFVDMLGAVGIDVSGKIKTIADLSNLANNIARAFETGETIKSKSGSGYVDSNGNNITENQLQFSLHNDFSDVKTQTTFTYLSNDEKFNKLKGDGTITNDKKLSDFEGKYIFLHSPDGAFSGAIIKNGEVLIEGKGGIYYPIKFHEDGYFWASTEGGANPMVKQLNEALKLNNGVAYMALTSAPADKLLSSTTVANGILDIFSSKIMDKSISLKESDVKSAFIKAAKARVVINKKNVGLGLKEVNSKLSLEELKAVIKEKLSPENSTFADRKHFNEQVVKHIVDNVKGKKAEQKLAEFFHLGISNLEMKGKTKKGYKLSKANVVAAISHMLQEPMLRNSTGSGNVYAILEVNGEVEAVDSKKHESYPKAIKAKSKDSKIKLHVLQDRLKWSDNFQDPTTGDIVKKERQLNIFPTSGVSTAPLKLSPQVPQFQKPDPISKTEKVKYMTEDGEGNYVFYHYSDKNLTKKGIDPKKFGKNTITGRDEKTLAPAAFYYTEPGISEPGTGNFAHVVRVPKDKVYPFNEDPKNFSKEAEKRFRKAHPDLAFDANKELAWTSVVAQENGYDVTVANWDGIGGKKRSLRAQSPVNLKPELAERPVPGTYNQVDVNEDLEFKSNRGKRKIQRQEPGEEKISDRDLKFAEGVWNKVGGNSNKFIEAMSKTERGKKLLGSDIIGAIVSSAKKSAKVGAEKTGEGKEKSIKRVLTNLYTSKKLNEGIKERLKDDEGLIRDVFTDEEAKVVVDELIAEVGIDGAMNLVRAGKITGAVKALVYGAATEHYSNLSDSATDPELKEEHADTGADIAVEFQKDAEEYGRFIRAIGTFYKNSPLVIEKRVGKQLKNKAKEALDKKLNSKNKIGLVKSKFKASAKYTNKGANSGLKTSKNINDAQSKLDKLKEQFRSASGKLKRQLTDYTDAQRESLKEAGVIYFADFGKTNFESFKNAMKEDFGISSKDALELYYDTPLDGIDSKGRTLSQIAYEQINVDEVAKADSKIKKLQDEIDNIDNSIEDLEVRKKAKEKEEGLKSTQTKDLENKIKEKEKQKKQKIKEITSKSQEFIDNEKKQVLDKYFPAEKLQSKTKVKKSHEKIIEQYNAGVFEGGTNKDGIPFEELFYSKLGIVNPNSKEIKAKIKEYAEKMSRAPEGSKMWNETNQEMLDYIADISYENWRQEGMDIVTAMWYANILSSPATHLRNLQYNVIQAMVMNPLLLAEKAIVKGDTKGAYLAIRDAFRSFSRGTTEAGRVFKEGKDSNLDVLGQRGVLERSKKFKWMVYPGRALRASDAIITNKSLEDKQKEIARKIVLRNDPNISTEALKNKVDDMVYGTKEQQLAAKEQAKEEVSKWMGDKFDSDSKPQKRMMKLRAFEIVDGNRSQEIQDEFDEALLWAKKATLTNRPVGIYGNISDAIQSVNKSLEFTKYFMPFVNVPLNITQKLLDHNAIVGTFKYFRGKEGVGKSDTELSDDQRFEYLLKGLNYSAAMTLVALLNGDDDDDFIVTGAQTGNYVDDKGIERGGGKKPYHLYLFGEPVLDYKMTPFFPLLAPAGFIRDYKKYGKDKDGVQKSTADGVASAAWHYMTFVGETSTMKGMGDLFDNIHKISSGSGGAEKMKIGSAKLINSLIPYSSALKYSNITTKSILGKYDTKPNTWVEYMYDGIPFADMANDTRFDAVGLPIKEDLNVPLIPVGSGGWLYPVKDTNKYYKLFTDKEYFPRFYTTKEMTYDGEKKKLSTKELYKLNKKRGDFVKKALDHKNIFIPKDDIDADPKKANMTTYEYLKTLDNDQFKNRMNKIFNEATGAAKLSLYAEKANITKNDIKNYEEKIDKYMRSYGYSKLEAIKRLKEKGIEPETKNLEYMKQVRKDGSFTITIKNY